MSVGPKQIIPAVIGQTWSEVESKLSWLEGRVPWVHLDVMDGRFTETVSWQTPNDLDFLAGRIKVEVHLMVESPVETLADWAGVTDRVIVHAENFLHHPADLDGLLEAWGGQPGDLGLALLLSTPIETIRDYLPRLRFIHLMSVERIGYHGQPFAAVALSKIKELKSLAPAITISVDGGLTPANIPAVFAAGADRAVVGAAIWRAADPAATLEQLLNLGQEAV